MIGVIAGIVRNDLAVWFRSRSAIAAALLPALGMGIVIAVLTNSVGRQPVAFVKNGQGRFSDRMARILEGDDDAYLLRRMSGPDAERALGDERVAAIIVVPENFDQAVANANAMVDLYVNNVDYDIADDLRRSVTRSVAEFDAPQLSLSGEEHGPAEGWLVPNPYRVAIAEKDLRKTNVSFLQYQVIPIIVLIIISVGLLGTALLTARDFERKTAKMMLLSRASLLPLVLGRLLSGALLTVLLVTPLMVLGFADRYIPACSEGAHPPRWLSVLLSGPCAWVLTVPSWGHFWAVVALLGAVILATAGLGTLLGMAVRDEKLVTLIGLNAATYLFFLGGGFTTVAFLPEWIQSVSRFIPTKYAIEGLRQALFYPDLVGFRQDLTVLAACAAISIALAALGLARAWRRTS